MKGLTLILGSKSLSSWSLRPWLFLKHHGIPFDEVVIPLDLPDTAGRILKHSPSGRVPALRHGSITVWESLAICEYVHETFGLPLAWPLDPGARALARSAAAEMHAGFADLRKEMPFKPTRKPEPIPLTDRAAADIGRIRQIWRGCRREYGKGGEWLFGAFGIVDAMFAPVALRFHSYGLKLNGPEQEYVYAMLMHPAINLWIEGATAESPPVPSLSGRMKQRLAERTLEKTLEKTQDAREVTEPVTRQVLVAARPAETPVVELGAPAPRRALPEMNSAPIEMPPVATPDEPSPSEPALHEPDPLSLPVIPPDPPSMEIALPRATTLPKLEPAAPEAATSDREEPAKGKIKSFILPP